MQHAKSHPGQARQSVYMRESSPACQGCPTCQGETAQPTSCLTSPRQVSDPHVSGLLNLSKK